jgi:hypothetical protein
MRHQARGPLVIKCVPRAAQHTMGDAARVLRDAWPYRGGARIASMVL